MGEATREMVATSSDCLRLFDLVGDEGGNSVSGGFVGRGRGNGVGTRLVPRAQLANTKADYSAPLTSFSWSTLEPTHIVTSSIDTTCTVWDIATSVPITQLIAHDREVYDVAWSPSSREVFASVGADGSVRMFDLRSLEHSTILYEATPAPAQKNGAVVSPPATTPIPSPLLRLAFSPTSPTYVSVCHADSADVQILDTRSPGTPAMEVRGHSGAINGMAWGGSTISGAGETVGPGWLATCSDDCTLLLWDLSTTTPNPPPTTRSATAVPKLIQQPVLSWSSPSEINAVAWGGGGDWVAAGCGRLVRCLK
ncbi:DDB1- and CUL4-associated factor 7, partial [Phenoliferia sp. Uapishka_3]